VYDIDVRFRIRESEEELQKLDEAIEKLGYKDRADWYRDMKRKTIERAKLGEVEDIRVLLEALIEKL